MARRRPVRCGKSRPAAGAAGRGPVRVPEPAGEKDPGGQPCKFQEEFVRIARAMCHLGATDAELAREFGVDPSTVRHWRTLFPEFEEACVIGKDAADKRVASALYHKACGYTYKAEELFVIDKVVTREEVWKHVPPDTAACFIWLKNRRPGEWRDKHDVDVTVTKREIKTAEELRLELEKRGIPPVIDCDDYKFIEHDKDK